MAKILWRSQTKTALFTTNWILNIDKRLRVVIPSNNITDKKRQEKAHKKTKKGRKLFLCR
jgi:hypothetical protein